MADTRQSQAVVEVAHEAPGIDILETQAVLEYVWAPTVASVTQAALEVVHERLAAAGVSATQAAAEFVRQSPPASGLRASQGALEAVQFPPSDAWATQVCLEVLFPALPPPAPASRRNHSFIGVWMGTGHGDNASFSF